MSALEQHSEGQLQASITGYSLVPASKSYVVYGEPSIPPTLSDNDITRAATKTGSLMLLVPFTISADRYHIEVSPAGTAEFYTVYR